GHIYCWGSNSDGQLGAGSVGGTNDTPVQISLGDSPGTFLNVTAGGEMVCAVGTNQKPYCWGSNDYGELGIDSYDRQSQPKLVSLGAGPADYRSISPGGFHTCALGLDQKAYCWGDNLSEGLGDNGVSSFESLVPVAVSLGDSTGSYYQVGAGYRHSCGLGLDRKLFCWGEGFDYQLGTGEFGSAAVPNQVSLGDNSSGIWGLGSDFIEVVLSNASSVDVIVPFGFSGTASGSGVDYQVLKSAVTIAAGGGAASGSNTIVDDSVFEGDETIVVTLGAPNVGSLGGLIQHTITIVDNESPPDLFVTDALAIEGEIMTFAVVASSVLESAISVNYQVYGDSATLGEDFAALSGVVTLAAGRSAAAISVYTLDDLDLESEETFSLSITSATGNVVDDTGLGIIADNDNTALPPIRILDTAGFEGDTLDLVVELVSDDSFALLDIEFEVTSVDGSAIAGADYTALINSRHTILTGFRAVTIPVVLGLDSVADDPEYFTVQISSLSGAYGADIVAVIDVLDIDDLGPSLTLSVYPGAGEEGDIIEFDVSISQAWPHDVTAYVFPTGGGSAISGADFIYDVDFVTIPAGDLSAKGRLLTVGDGIIESDETVVVSLFGTSDGVIDLATSTLTIVNSGLKCPDEGWCQKAFLKASNTDDWDLMGWGGLSASRDYVAVAAYLEDSSRTTISSGASASADNTNSDSGAVYVFEQDQVTREWSQSAYIKASNADSSDQFGLVVASEGDTLVVATTMEASNSVTIVNGSSSSSDNSAAGSGAVYVYKKNGLDEWMQEAYIKPQNLEAGDGFGYSVAISGDILVVSALREDSSQTTITNGDAAPSDNASGDRGAVYIYKRTGSTWVQEAYLKADNGDSSDKFGQTVAIDRDTVAISTNSEDSNLTTIQNGTSVTLDNNLATNSGAVYVYKRNAGIWEQQAYIKAANSEASDFFGEQLSLQGDTLVVSAIGEDSGLGEIINGTTASSDNSVSSSGSVYVYKRTGDNWAQQAHISDPSPQVDGYFGWKTSVWGDRLVVTKFEEDTETLGVLNGVTKTPSERSADLNRGAAYVFERNGSSWSLSSFIQSYEILSEDYGTSVYLDGDQLFVGEGSNNSGSTLPVNDTQIPVDNGSTGSGAVHVYYNKGPASVVVRPAPNQPQPAASLPIEWQVQFSKPIDPSSFTTSDVSLDLASTGAVSTWNIVNSGDDRNFTLQATALSVEGSLIPEIDAGAVTDLDGFDSLANSENFDTTVSLDGCFGSVTIGTVCDGRAIFAGGVSGNDYMVTPGGCNDSATPTCTGGGDVVSKTWYGTGGSYVDITGVENLPLESTPSTNTGDVFTAAIVVDSSVGSDSAAHFCDAMI
ncbi:MAG: hypothetical protein HRT45_18860, partial [Bdellovibrionales bacterium]|nr:hypothetical protein [Bdellovibrionales bacterium]